MDEKIYNALQQFAEMRRRVVSDIPEDIDISGYGFDEDEEALILRGISLVHAFILSIYESVAEYARTEYMTPKIIESMAKKGGVMLENRKAQGYLNAIYEFLLDIAKNGEYDFNTATFTVSRDFLQNSKFKYSQTLHLKDFCSVECKKDNAPSDYKKCDSISFSFDNNALCFTLRHIVSQGVTSQYFQYGDFRLYSKSGRNEDMQKYPEGVRKKALGNNKFNLYRKLDKYIYDNFIVTGIGENGYQGYGSFNLSKAYEIALDKTELRFWMGEDKLTIEVYFGLTAFEKLPEIIELLSERARNGILSKQPCGNCKFQCKSKRQAVFNENIFSNRIFTPCNMGGEGFEICDEDDAESAVIIFKHILKFTPQGKGKVKWNKK